jgi:2-polyprenyl-3-methyl-5-hydroxy-6-metoxy-1,4-benzoquinol methylase
MRVQTDSPVAADSLDHLEPKGTALDNSRNGRFNQKLYTLYRSIGRPLRILDLGCSGGGFVRDCLSDGHIAIGIEGSDYSARRGRAEWPELGGRALFTADIRKHFEIRDDESSARRMTFDVVSLWEVLEHMGETDLPTVFGNIRSHLEPGGLVVASISGEPLTHHRTVRSQSWWLAMFREQQFTPLPALVTYFATQFIRGPKYGAPGSFHIVATNDPVLAPGAPPPRMVTQVLDHVWYGSAAFHRVRRLVGIE